MAHSAVHTENDVPYRDLNGNGRMDPYEDPRLPPEERVADLVPRLSREEKVGLLFHAVIGEGEPGAYEEPGVFGTPSARETIVGQAINHFSVVAGADSARALARWQNALQELAEQTPHGIPITFSTDPRHGFSEHQGMAFAAGPMSQWPEPLGLAAIGDRALVRQFADVARQEYLALGFRAALHPQVDLATEPRWARQMQTFGADSGVAAELTVAYLEGMQGKSLGPESVACTTKHFPGGGAQKDGEDPHFPYGREQVYPGGRLEDHLLPFRAAIGAGTSAVMPYYGMPVGLELNGSPVEEVGFSFNRRIVTELLREQLGFDGVVLTDWGLITDLEIGGRPFPAKAWGVEDLSPEDRMAKILEAGADQFGGEACTELLLGLLASGRVSEARIDESVRRLLLVKFRLGLFDDPYVDEDAAERVVGCSEFRALGHTAQAQAVTVLKNNGTLPLSTGRRVYIEGVDRAAAEHLGTVVDEPGQADVAVVRLQAPFEVRSDFFLEDVTHQGSLAFPKAVVEHVAQLAAQVPVVLDVYLDRPAILTELDALATALVVDFGASDAAMIDALTGRIRPLGRLPFELPRSMDAVRTSRPDVANDTADPLYPSGAGRSY